MSGLIMIVVLGAIFFGYLGWFAWAAWSERFAGSRLAVIVRLVECAALMIMARQLFAWGTVPVVWLLAVVIIAVGVAGAAGRWARLPWLQEKKSPTLVVSGATVRVLVAGALGGLMLS